MVVVKAAAFANAAEFAAVPAPALTLGLERHGAAVDRDHRAPRRFHGDVTNGEVDLEGGIGARVGNLPTLVVGIELEVVAGGAKRVEGGEVVGGEGWGGGREGNEGGEPLPPAIRTPALRPLSVGSVGR